MYYASNCDDIIKLLPEGSIWCFGHTHIPTNTEIYGVRCISNPVGYIRVEIYPDKMSFDVK